MENEITRRVKSRHFSIYRDCDFSVGKENSSLFLNKLKLNTGKALLPLVSNSTGSNTSQQRILCSREIIKIDCNLNSEEMSAVPKNKRSSENNERVSQKNTPGSCSSPVAKKAKEDVITDDLLSLDDSLLARMDLSNIKSDGKNTLGIHTVNEIKSNTEDLEKKYVDSPDIFSTNQESKEDIDSEDRPWDMSISVVDNKNNSVIEEKSPSKNAIPMSPGLSDVILSTWVCSPERLPKQNDNRTSEDLLKKTLNNNAHKAVIYHSSPRSLFSSPRSKSSNDSNFFGLPSDVKRLIRNFKGISKLYEWQEECLRLPAIEKRKNLVYALPTSGGKTLVAEILVLKEVLCREKNVLFVLPYVSITQEKVRALSPFAVELGFVVEEYAGSKGVFPPQKRRRKRSVYIATIEKALGLVHSLLENQRLEELGLVVVDELHLVGEPRRGAHLESTLTKLMSTRGDIQIIGMSATIGNLSEIAKFLDADVYTQEFRPVELTEYVKVDDELFKVDHSVEDEVPLVFHSKTNFKCSPEQRQQDPDQVGALVREVAPEHSCLVFCPSKKNCENVALMVCHALRDKSIMEYKSEEKKALFRALMVEGNGTVCSILRRTIPLGVAYHHSGLTTAERSLLEEAFLAKTICCICCTSTLAAGVNLPARRVVLRSPYLGTQLLTLSRYKQMVGRAGRAGLGDTGESFLLCRPQDAQKVGELLASAMDLCCSQLRDDGLAGLIVSSVDLGLAPDLGQLLNLCRSTLLAVQSARLAVDIDSEVNNTLDKLIEVGAIKRSEDKLALTNIGKAAVKANLDMDTCKLLYRDLQQAQDSLVLLSHLHLLYLVTPYASMEQIRFQQQPFCKAYMELGPKEVQTAKVLGVGEQCVARLMTGRPIKGSLNQTLHRFYLSLILFDLWNQTSVWRVSAKYSLPRGLIHNLLVSASAFASSVVRFCEVLEEMWCFKLLLADMSSRLTHCCSAELLPLMELPAVKIGRARQLFNAGFKTLSILAKTEPKALVETVDHMPRKVAHQIVAAAKLLLLAKAESLQEEAEEVLEGL